MRTIKEIDNEILKLKQDLKNVKGTVTEVYSRIVGYYRNINQSNPGRQQEYKERKTFDIDKSMSRKV